MSETANNQDHADVPQGPSLLRVWRTIETEASWFILANFLDSAMTWLALMYGGGPGRRMVEGNRVAGYMMDHWGFKGMFALKASVVVFVCLISLVIARRNVESAQRLLQFGTLIVILVVLYSVLLYIRVRGGV